MVLSVQKIIDNMAVVAKEYPIERAELFGSYANGQSTAASDVDIIMEFSTPQVSLLMLNDIRYRLEELLSYPQAFEKFSYKDWGNQFLQFHKHRPFSAFDIYELQYP